MKNLVKIHAMLLLVLAALELAKSIPLEDSDNDENAVELSENAQNVCIDQQVRTQIVNVTYIQPQDVVDYTWCVKIPPRCRVYRTKLVTRWKQENVTRVVNVRHCCPGFDPDGSGQCKATCEVSCGEHGTCKEPGVCTCNPGFSGKYCQEAGCKDGNWGPDCSRPCSCQNGGRCEPYTGACQCAPGWQGVDCQKPCPAAYFGVDCADKCACALGQKCHHVTGECLPCTPGTYGYRCERECDCERNGTALCLHTNGQCFCRPNWYGQRCEQHCPFGYVDEVCHVSQIEGAVCQCFNDQMECTPDRGCVCKANGDCGGGQRLSELSLAAPLEDDDGGNGSSSSTVAIVLSVLFLALATTFLVVVYYRRRMSRLKKDLNNRSVYYMENSILDPARHHAHDLVITNNDEDLLAANNDEGRDSNLAPNNNAAAVQRRAEKNVNIDRFKLGMMADEQLTVEQPTAQAEHQSGAAPADDMMMGACALPPDERQVVAAATTKKPVDVNVFDEDFSPSKEKNNFVLDNTRKINKTGIDLVFRRNNLAENGGDKDDGDDDDEIDDIAIAKMTTYLDDEEH